MHICYYFHHAVVVAVEPGQVLLEVYGSTEFPAPISCSWDSMTQKGPVWKTHRRRSPRSGPEGVRAS